MTEFSTEKFDSLTNLYKMAGGANQLRSLPNGKKLILQEANRTDSFITSCGHILHHPFQSAKNLVTLSPYKLALDGVGSLSPAFKSWGVEQLGQLIVEPEEFANDLLIASQIRVLSSTRNHK